MEWQFYLLTKTSYVAAYGQTFSHHDCWAHNTCIYIYLYSLRLRAQGLLTLVQQDFVEYQFPNSNNLLEPRKEPTLLLTNAVYINVLS